MTQPTKPAASVTELLLCVIAEKLNIHHTADEDGGFRRWAGDCMDALQAIEDEGTLRAIHREVEMVDMVCEVVSLQLAECKGRPTPELGLFCSGYAKAMARELADPRARWHALQFFKLASKLEPGLVTEEACEAFQAALRTYQELLAVLAAPLQEAAKHSPDTTQWTDPYSIREAAERAYKAFHNSRGSVAVGFVHELPSVKNHWIQVVRAVFDK